MISLVGLGWSRVIGDLVIGEESGEKIGGNRVEAGCYFPVLSKHGTLRLEKIRTYERLDSG